MVNGSPNVETLHLEDADNKDTDKETDNQKIENKEAKSLRGSQSQMAWENKQKIKGMIQGRPGPQKGGPK